MWGWLLPLAALRVPQGDVGVRRVKIKVSAKTSRRTIYPCSLFFAETDIYPISLWPKNKTINYKDQLF